MLIITGPGRSGTSVLARFCQQSGYDPGGTWCDPIDAGMEDERVVRINDALLAALRASPGEPPPIDEFRERIAAVRRAVLKDPRFSFHPGVLRAWHAVHPDLAVLYTYRTPELCLRSRRRVPGMLMMRHHHDGPDTVRRDMADCVEAMLELEVPFRFLLFPHFLEHFDRVHCAFRDLGLEVDPEEGEAIWRRLVDRRKVHIGEPRRRALLHGLGAWLHARASRSP